MWEMYSTQVIGYQRYIYCLIWWTLGRDLKIVPSFQHFISIWQICLGTFNLYFWAISNYLCIFHILKVFNLLLLLKIKVCHLNDYVKVIDFNDFLCKNCLKTRMSTWIIKIFFIFLLNYAVFIS